MTSSISASLLICRCCSEFMPLLFSGHQELAANKNRQTIRSAVCHFSGGDFCSTNYFAAHRRELSFSLKAPWPSTARLPDSSESFLMWRKRCLSCVALQPELI